MGYIDEIGSAAKKASARLAGLGILEKNEALKAAAQALKDHAGEIMAANQKDLEKARANGMKESLIDRLKLDEKRIASMADGLVSVAGLKDVLGEIVSSEVRPNGLKILEKRVPMGVIGIIYEARPNVTADAFALCFKTGNCAILRGGSDAIESNLAIVKVIRDSLKASQVPEDALILVEKTDRETATEMMRANKYIDVLIPRGGAGLISSVVQNSTVPVIETGTGNCHVFVDESADQSMALDIIDNAKTQRLGVCNACESLVVHRKIASEFLPKLYERLTAKQIVFRADESSRAICPDMEAASEEDFYREYLDRLVSLKIVDSVDEAIDHINEHNTGHSESIITSDYDNAMKFLDRIDAAAVYVNASTRFTDGGEFGMGAEIGISTQKLHARGPMGMKALTTTKFVIFGNGQTRP